MIEVSREGDPVAIRGEAGSLAVAPRGRELALVGTVNIPIIYKSVDWWHSLHQPATIKFTEETTMHSSMLMPLLVMIVGFYFFYTTVLFLFMRSEILINERKTGWVKALVSKTAEG